MNNNHLDHSEIKSIGKALGIMHVQIISKNNNSQYPELIGRLECHTHLIVPLAVSMGVCRSLV